MNIKLIFFIALTFTSVTSYAGAWGEGPFENDAAADFVYDVSSSKSIKILTKSFDDIPESGFIDSDLCSVAIASAALTASLKDGDIQGLPDSLVKWIKTNSDQFSPKLAKSATLSLASCKDTSRSELVQLWSEGNPKVWLNHIRNIELRLKKNT